MFLLSIDVLFEMREAEVQDPPDSCKLLLLKRRRQEYKHGRMVADRQYIPHGVYGMDLHAPRQVQCRMHVW